MICREEVAKGENWWELLKRRELVKVAQKAHSYTKTGHKRAHEMGKRSSKIDFKAPSIACTKIKHMHSLISSH